MRKMNPLLLLIGGALFMLTSCYKSETVYYDELDVTQTSYEVDFNFSSYTSFAMPDSTILKTNFMTEQEIEAFFTPGGAGDKTLELLKTSFESRGYTYTGIQAMDGVIPDMDGDGPVMVGVIPVMAIPISIKQEPSYWKWLMEHLSERCGIGKNRIRDKMLQMKSPPCLYAGWPTSMVILPAARNITRNVRKEVWTRLLSNHPT
jgi:hypothetical protein